MVFERNKNIGTVIFTKEHLRPESRLRAVVSELEKIGMRKFHRRYSICRKSTGYEIRYRHTPGIVALIVDAS